MTETENSDLTERGKQLKVFILLTLTVFISSYFYFRDFGFYEDDYYHITLYLKITFTELVSFIGIRITNWFQGHPFAFFPSLFTYLAMKTGGVPMLYIFSFLILSLNAFLFYKLLKKIKPGSEIFAVSGALMFILFPANTTKILLTYSFTMQLALTFFIAACLFYLSERKVLSYIFILFSLFLYEPVFMVFFGIPLLKIRNTENRGRAFLKHTGIMLSILIITFIVRKMMGEARISGMLNNFPGFAKDIFSGIVSGPLTIFKNLARTPFTVFREMNSADIVFMAAGFVLIMVTFYLTNTKTKTENISYTSRNITLTDSVKMILVSVILIMLSYTIPLIQNYPVTIEYGRMSSVHTAAVTGSSLLFGMICDLFVNSFRKNIIRTFALAVISIYLSFIFAYNVIIQNDFARSREIQKDFWTEVKGLCPDLKDSTLVFAVQNENNKLRNSKYINSNSWLDPTILKQIYQFPDYWKNPPRLFVMNEDWEKKVFVNEDKLKWRVPPATWISYNEILPDSNLIILRCSENNKLTRDYSPVKINNNNINLRPENSPEFKSWKKGVLDSYLIRQ